MRSSFRRFLRTFRLSGSRRATEREVRDEIELHLELRARELMDRGMGEEEARRAAREAFGDVERISAEVRRIADERRRRKGRLESAGDVWRDLRLAVRGFARSPGFTLTALATLALGIGATTAIFSVAERAFLREPPVSDASELVAVYTTSRRGFPRSSSSYPDYRDYRERTGALEDLAAVSGLPASLGDERAGSALVTVRVVTGNYFPLLGVRPLRGRVLGPADDVRDGASRSAVLSHRLWRTHFGSDPEVVGRTVRLNEVPFEVVGVAPEGFSGVTLGSPADVWVPMFAGPAIGEGFAVSGPGVWDERGNRWISRLVGRLAPGATVERAREELLAVSEQLRREDPDARGERSVTVDWAGRYTLPVGSEEAFRGFLLLLSGVVAFTLLLACVSLANLLLARGSTRGHEIAVRRAIGAGGGSLVRGLLLENLLLALVGGALGVGVAAGLLRVLGAFELPGGVTVESLGVTVDGTLLLLALGLSVATGLVFGSAPALQALRTDVVSTLRREERGARGGQRARKVLVGVQVALCTVLLIGSGLFLRTLREGLRADLGLEADEVVLARYNLDLLGYDASGGGAFAEELLERVRGLPDVRQAAVSSRVPLQAGGARGMFVTVEGYEPPPDEEMRVDFVLVTPGYFESLGMRVLGGRTFTEADGADSEPVMVVDRTTAERWWPEGDAVGGRIGAFGDDLGFRVVGVVERATWVGLDDPPTPYVFVSLGQFVGQATGFLTLSARTDGEAEALTGTVGAIFRALEPRLALSTLQTMEDQRERVLTAQRLGAFLLTFFGAVALVLAGVGISGVVAFAVSRRAREIGIRIALGAESARVVGVMIGTVAWPVAAGLAAGLAGSALLAGAVETFLFGVRPGDPATYAAIVLLLGSAALLAAWLPARGAARADPAEALRSE